MTGGGEVSFASGAVTLEFAPQFNGKIRLSARSDGETLEAGKYSDTVFDTPQVRSTFLKPVEESLEGREGVDAAEVRREMREWFAGMSDRIESTDATDDPTLPDEAKRIIRGTESVEVHGGETTTWNVDLTLDGKTATLRLDYKDWTSSNPTALRDELARRYYKSVPLDESAWHAIRDEWEDRQKVVSVTKETASDAVANRVLESLSESLRVVDDREHMARDPANVWYDGQNETGLDAPGVGPDSSIAWVQSKFLNDHIESAGKQVGYKAQLVQDLKARADLYDGRWRKTWGWDSRTAVYPFDPEVLGINGDDVAEAGEPAHSEVSP